MAVAVHTLTGETGAVEGGSELAVSGVPVYIQLADGTAEESIEEEEPFFLPLIHR